VHQAVRPVKIGIVQNYHQQNAEKVIKPAIFICRGINQREPFHTGNYRQHNYRTKYQYSKKGVSYLADNVFFLRVALLNLEILITLLSPYIKKQVKRARKYQVTTADVEQ